MLLISWVAVAFVVVFFIAKHFSSRYQLTQPPIGRILRVFRGDRDYSNNKVSDLRPTLSVVIPCFNEAARLPSMLKDCVAYCRQQQSLGSTATFRDVEIIVVDDCSTDETIQVAKQCMLEANASATESTMILFSIVPVKPNHGKGFAVRTGFFAASGDYVLMADGDNATTFADVEKLAAPVNQGADIAVGSRAHLEKASVAQRTFFRTLLMKLFHVVVHVTYFIATLGKRCKIHDTQCGFKLFRRRACEKLFKNNRLERWAFDVEILILAKRFQMQVEEVCVEWREIEGSKVRLGGMVQMGLECLMMCVAYPLSLWPVEDGPRLV